MQKHYLAGFRMNDKEKIEKALELLDDLVKFTNNLKENRTAYGYPQHLLKEIKKILEE